MCRDVLPLGEELVVDPESHRTFCSKCRRPAMWAEFPARMREKRGQLDRWLVDPKSGVRHRCNPTP